MSRIVAFETTDIRFPTSLSLDGSDAMNPDPDYSAAYLRIATDAADGVDGHAFVFTIGRGNDVQVAALDALAGHLVGREVEPLLDDMGATNQFANFTPQENLGRQIFLGQVGNATCAACHGTDNFVPGAAINNNGLEFPFIEFVINICFIIPNSP